MNSVQQLINVANHEEEPQTEAAQQSSQQPQQPQQQQQPQAARAPKRKSAAAARDEEAKRRLPPVYSILNSRKKTNAFADNSTYYYPDIAMNKKQISDFMSRNKHVIDLMGAKGKEDWKIFRRSQFIKALQTGLKDVDDEFEGVPIPTRQSYSEYEQARIAEVLEEAVEKHATPEVALNIGKANVVSYNGFSDEYAISKFFFGKNDGTCREYSVNLKIRSLPSLILALQSLHQHIVDKLQAEGKSGDLSKETPSTKNAVEEDNLAETVAPGIINLHQSKLYGRALSAPAAAAGNNGGYYTNSTAPPTPNGGHGYPYHYA